ncbi:glycosyltransferase family 4 protein [Perlabentimonas gracilis]|uniref:glycosyltransferase family 4 protein n=1 Tax=Perlabentimonas gracilis TaxID=2715279 RepID=UPI001408742C|nr:glycosyltransferase family 4 protein [Perlabentimonas gracilis]NHB67687.1 glycosyltransferase family 4 protein [Perlabentimonas gracilis]
MKIYAFHLLNDYSGSPKVLMQLAKGWVNNGLKVCIVTSTNSAGFLSNIEGVIYHNHHYIYFNNVFLRLIAFCISQLIIFIRALVFLKKSDIVYVNTVLPFAASIAGKIKGCRVINHIHETSIRPVFLKKFLFYISRICSTDSIYVSDFLLKLEHNGQNQPHVLHNALEQTFVENAKFHLRLEKVPKNVLMISSLKEYKGVDIFLSLTSKNPQFSFRLVLNATTKQGRKYFKNTLPTNLEIFYASPQLYEHYQWADIVVNLSFPDRWIETFGLSVLEGMAYSLPAITPNVGGITELVTHNYNGFQVNPKDFKKLNGFLNEILKDRLLYERMSNNALKRTRYFNEDLFIQRNIGIIKDTCPPPQTPTLYS